jgi:hypothetical protein
MTITFIILRKEKNSFNIIIWMCDCGKEGIKSKAGNLRALVQSTYDASCIIGCKFLKEITR